jgi:hypothetical protein
LLVIHDSQGNIGNTLFPITNLIKNLSSSNIFLENRRPFE